MSDNTHVCMTGLGRNVRFPAILLAAAVVVVGWFAPLPAQDLSDLDDLLATPLEELMEIDVTLASGIEESIFDAPAAMVVITAGRNANPDLKPEKARNLEFVGMARTGRLFNDVSLFYSHLGDRIPGEVYGPESHA